MLVGRRSLRARIGECKSRLKKRREEKRLVFEEKGRQMVCARLNVSVLVNDMLYGYLCQKSVYVHFHVEAVGIQRSSNHTTDHGH